MKLKGKIIPVLIFAAALLFAGILILYSTKTAPSTVSVKYPDGYTVITADNAESNEEYIEKLGYGVASFKKYLEKKYIVSFAGNKDNSSQFRLISRKTEFTAQLGDISGATDSELKTVASELLPNGYDYIYRIGNLVFFEIDTVVKSEEGGYNSIQFITVKNGSYYSLVFYGSDLEITDNQRALAEDTLKTMKIPESGGVMGADKGNGIKRIVYLTIITLVIVAGVVLIVLHTISLIRDIRGRKKRSDYADFVIKRRKK